MGERERDRPSASPTRGVEEQREGKGTLIIWRTQHIIQGGGTVRNISEDRDALTMRKHTRMRMPYWLLL